MRSDKHKVFTTREIKSFGFTLIEVMISLVLIGAALAFSTKVFVAGKYFLKEAENKARAMEIASLEMNKRLTLSYEELGHSPSIFPATGTEDGIFIWTVDIQSDTERGVGTGNTIPYRTILVDCTYQEKNINGVESTKRIELFNIVPYPSMHLFNDYAPSATYPAKLVQCFSVFGICRTNALNVYNSNRIASRIIAIDVPLKVRSDLLIFYNISIDVTPPNAAIPGSSINATDLIFTKCFLRPPGGGVPVEIDIQTGTPVLTQPTINNVVSISNLAANVNPYILEIIWFKDHNTGIINLKKVNIAVFQVEKP